MAIVGRAIRDKMRLEKLSGDRECPVCRILVVPMYFNSHVSEHRVECEGCGLSANYTNTLEGLCLNCIVKAGGV